MKIKKVYLILIIVFLCFIFVAIFYQQKQKNDVKNLEKDQDEAIILWSEREEIFDFVGKVIKINNDSLDVAVNINNDVVNLKVMIDEETEVIKTFIDNSEGFPKMKRVVGNKGEIVIGSEVLVKSNENILNKSSVYATDFEYLMDSSIETIGIIQQINNDKIIIALPIEADYELLAEEGRADEEILPVEATVVINDTTTFNMDRSLFVAGSRIKIISLEPEDENYLIQAIRVELLDY